jgi:hypothetical protein
MHGQNHIKFNERLFAVRLKLIKFPCIIIIISSSSSISNSNNSTTTTTLGGLWLLSHLSSLLCPLLFLSSL